MRSPVVLTRLSRRLALLLAALLGLTLVLLPAPAAQAAAAGSVVGVASGRCLDVSGGSTAAGSGVVIWGCNGRASQVWTRTAAAELRVHGGSRCLEVAAGAGARSGRAQIAACTGAANQRWSFGADATVRAASGLCLDVAGAARTNGTTVQVYACHGHTNQQWRVPAAPDTAPPSVPANARTSGLTCSSVTFAWDASTDDSGVTAYDVYHDGQLVRSVPATTRSTTLSVVPGATWGLYVNARDAAGNVSQASRTVTITPPACSTDSTAPTRPTGLTAAVSGTTVTLRWTASSDNVGVRAYDVRRAGTRVGTVSGSPPATTFTDSGLTAGTSYRYDVLARDAAGNVSAASDAVTVTTGTGCTVCGVTQVGTEDDIPWGLVTLPDGSVLYARRDGHNLVRLDPATGTKTDVGTVPGVSGTDGEGGLLGLELSPTFASDHWLYVMHTSSTDNRIIRLKLNGTTLDTASRQVLLTGIGRNKYHNGGRLRFGPDGKLYASTGDAQNGDNAQNLAVLSGKVLRINPDGSTPADNPFGTAVWSYGHRNPQGLAFDSQGRLWEQEFGNSVMDETNLIVRGGNYGWPACEGTTGSCGNAGFVAPKRTYPTAEGSCSGIAVVRDVLYVACARGTRLYREVISGSSLTNVQVFLNGTYGRLRTVEPAPGGDLWLTTTNLGDKDSVAGNSNEKILRVDLG